MQSGARQTGREDQIHATLLVRLCDFESHITLILGSRMKKSKLFVYNLEI